MKGQISSASLILPKPNPYRISINQVKKTLGVGAGDEEFRGTGFLGEYWGYTGIMEKENGNYRDYRGYRD